MKTLVTTLGLTAALAIGVASTSTMAAGMADGWMACNAGYSACLRDGSNMSFATNVNDAVARSSSNVSNWSSCNSALVACYQSLK
ncbi:MAG: hypothetical protein GY761_14560 [Hyphomicrobiales bacterium]|nr:hypothetical protein [Hyphomicrobiales bacterium]